ncbi:hypothetical protein A7985_17875 [Pseudoalteromonas luteoviolacea]|uniref:DUF4340 domain-containing protein n=1 Tax=Pseudoalteromonas luteoviolacea TaxID=43657 RepID=A0A1C0TN63_9GAMM|nr:hypothetical protein [Pseudoalteromonas luteoviolacea]MBQ4812168.1 hypothetical protein [Pseudoalteromonas luteoviolacea]OCQ20290.1 hypothetical protein A7985_17875 [Pseudoalteromonas luteoviolacea]
MGLSRKAWNNVVIFSMLIMIFFLNGLHHKLNPPEEELGSVRVLPEQSFVLALAYPGVKIERIGTSWRIESELPSSDQKGYTEQDLVAIVKLWQSSELEMISPPQVNTEQAVSVATFWLAAEELPLSYQLYHINGEYVLFAKRSHRWLQLTPQQARQLFKPIEV